ncbi:MAG TPA: SGNH/GDSL hydrolase family protein [Micromonosporaceae bacterium]
MRWRRYVAVGDSFTEGMDDPHDDGRGLRGWADLVAGRLAAQCRAEQPGEDFHYANLAVRGRLFNAIVDQQVPEALAMRPDLISFAGGGNDVLRRRFDPHAMLARFDQVVGTMRATGADVVLFRWADVTSRLPGRRIILPRMRILNPAVQEVADRHGAHLVDLWHDDEFANPKLWSEDRLHMSAAGHRRVAAHVLTALGITPDLSWLDPAPAPPRRTWLAARSHDARWVREHLGPWLKRRLTGRSSGDTVTAKRPTLTPVTEEPSSGRLNDRSGT